MNNKFCTNCGHANPSISNGVAVRFCSKCGHDMSSLSSFSNKKQGEQNKRKYIEIEEDEYENFDFSEGAEIEYEIEVDRSPKMTFGDIAGKGSSGFSRGRGYGSEDIQKEIFSECKTNRNNPTDV